MFNSNGFELIHHHKSEHDLYDIAPSFERSSHSWCVYLIEISKLHHQMQWLDKCEHDSNGFDSYSKHLSHLLDF